MRFHSRWGKKTYLKAQKCSKFLRHALLHDRMFELVIHTKAKVWAFSYKFRSSFIGRGFAYRAKSWLQLRTNTVHLPFLFSTVQAAALKLRSVFKSHLKAHRSSCFRHSWRKEKLFTRKVWGLRSCWSSILRPPKHLFVFSLSILSAKEVICPF